MTHLSPDDVVLGVYDELPAEPRTHLDGCAECRARVDEVRRELDDVASLEVPEPEAGWEQRAWSRLQPELTPRTASARPWMAFLATAAALIVAFTLGREFPRTPQPGPSTAATQPPGAPDRVLLLAASDHLERSQLLLIEVMNADAGDARALPRERAEELVASSRLVRQAAAEQPAIADVLDELERVLVEIAHAPADGTEVAALHRRIQGRSLLFKVRVLGTELRKAQAPKPPGTSL